MPVPPSSRPTSPTVSVVIPAQAGGASIRSLLAGLPPVHEVIVVVAGEAPPALASGPATRVIRQTRTGPGNALACGVAVSTGDVVVALTGDGSCDPAELPRYVAALIEGADVAQGSRYRAAGGDRAGGRPQRWAALTLRWVITTLFGFRRTDPGFGYRAFWRDVADELGLPRVAGTEPMRGDGPEIEALMTIRAAAHGLRVTEVPAIARPGSGAPALLIPLRAVVTEYAEGRRAAPTADEPADIVVFTGGRATAYNPARPPDARLVAEGGAARRWPMAEPRDDAAELLVDRRRGGRAMRAAARLEPSARLTGGKGERPQARPNLRVINGEGGDAGPRTGRLRALPQP